MRIALQRVAPQADLVDQAFDALRAAPPASRSGRSATQAFFEDVERRACAGSAMRTGPGR